MRQRQPRVRDERHLRLIRQLPCLICGRYPAEAAHIRYGDAEHGKPKTGAGEKPDDKWTLPLCAEHHRTGKDAQHGAGERRWWESWGVDPLALCNELSDCATFEDMEAVYFAYRIFSMGRRDHGPSSPSEDGPGEVR